MADEEMRLYDLRERVRKGEDVVAEEYEELLDDMREKRKLAPTKKSGGGKTKKPSTMPTDLNDLFKTSTTEAVKL